MDLKLSGKRAFVSGAERGTGAVIAGALAREGVRVALHGFSREKVEGEAKRLRDEGLDAVAVAGDILSDDGAKEAFEEAVDALGGLDILINNYGIADGKKWASAETEAWEESYNHNVLSAARLTRLAMDPLKQAGWGRIVNLGTIGTTNPAAERPHYYAAKGAMAVMTASLAKELSETGITVNLVSPGLIRTAEVEAWIRRMGEKRGWEGSWEKLEAEAVKLFGGNLTGRIATREEVADAVAFLCSPRADSINAVNLRIDGGTTALMA